MFRVKRHLLPTRPLTRLWSGPLLLIAWSFGGGGMVWAAEAGPSALLSQAPGVQEEQPGAAALLVDGPLQVGLREHGSAWPLDPDTSPGRVLEQGNPPKPEAQNVIPPQPAPEGAREPARDQPAPTSEVYPAGAPPAGGHPPGAASPTPSPSPGAPKPPAAQTAPPAATRLLILDRRRKVLRVLEGNREVRRYPVAVGMPGWETPVGQFTVHEKRANPTWEHPASGHLLPPGPANPLGSRWIGFYRDCRGRSGFNGQVHLVVKGCVDAGFHGTPNRGSVGRAVSHGCVRLLDEHAKELFDLVSLGTPVTVLP